ncbi:hypothetical protein [uncultured Chloroflexus sp.]|uniref:hypothetical protein n=1 Tax=uncultured Chloroflexus sp. TaxID=214040 RepID=UPI00261AA6C3|nr:hypothetical protein [uncultured Chloroflexus sp.]
MRRYVAIVLIVCSLLSVSVAAAQSQRTFTLDFEGFPDNQSIDAYGGLVFQFGWRFGDLRSGRYNAPFPASCPDFGGTCAFAVNGNGFARVSGAGTGAIALPAGVVAFSAAASTSDPLTFTAFAAGGIVLGTAVVVPNTFTGQLDRVTLTAPPNQTIATIEVSGTRDTWLIDDVQYTVDLARGGRPARLTLAQRVDDVARPGEVVTLDLVLENYGRGSVFDATIELPFDDNTLILLDATPSRAGVWVSEVQSGLITIRTGPLAANRDLVRMTIRFRVRDDAPHGVAIGRVARLAYRDSVTDFGHGQSNVPRTTIGPGPELNHWRAPEITVAGSTLTYAAAGFAPGEPVGIWYNPPDGAPPVAVTTVRADGDGRVSGELSLRDVPAGEYSFVLFSHHSQQTFVGGFAVAASP